jgi:hypothetical protein
LIQARADLATLLQLPAEKLPAVKGSLDVKPELPYTLDQLLAAAASRAQLRALDYREQAARNRLGLERAAVYPDVTVGLSSAREGPGDAREKLVGLSVSIPLPFFRRNAAGIGKASAELTQAEIEKQAAARDTRARVLALWQKLDSLRQRVRRMDQSVLQRLEENQRLSTAAYRAGEISLVQMLLATAGPRHPPRGAGGDDRFRPDPQRAGTERRLDGNEMMSGHLKNTRIGKELMKTSKTELAIVLAIALASIPLAGCGKPEPSPKVRRNATSRARNPAAPTKRREAWRAQGRRSRTRRRRSH